MDRENFENLVMAAGYRSCFGCLHHGERSRCKGCNVTNSRWEPNERWQEAQARGKEQTGVGKNVLARGEELERDPAGTVCPGE